MDRHFLWKLSLENEFKEYTISGTPEGDGFVARAMVTETSEVIAKSSWKMTQWDAYKELFDMLHDGETNILPQLTTSQRDSLDGIRDGRPIINLDYGRIDCFMPKGDWQSSAGPGMMQDVSYGEMFEDNSTGSPISNSGDKLGIWVTSEVGNLDKNGIITFVDYQLIVGEGGAGDYAVSFNVNFTCDKPTNCFGYFHVDGDDIEKVKDVHDIEADERGDLSAAGILTLEDGDFVELHILGGDPTAVIKVYQVNVNIRRIS